MPFVKIYLREGKTQDYLEGLGRGVHEALVSSASVPVDDRFQVIVELSSENLRQHATYGGVQRSDDLVIVEITLNAGRTTDVKRALYAAIAANLDKAVGLRPDDVLISLVEVTKENWSFGGGRATYA